MAPKALALRFGGMALALVLLAGAWSFAAPGYTRALVFLGGVLAPGSVSLEPTRAHEITFRYTQPTLLGDPWVSINALTLQGGPLLLAALVLLTPRLSLARRGRALLATGACSLALHLLLVALEAWSVQWWADGRAVDVDTTAAVEPLFSFVLPALAAALWCWRFWRPALRGTIALPPVAPRRRPEPDEGRRKGP